MRPTLRAPLIIPLIDKIKVQAIPQAHAIMQAEADAKAQELVENTENPYEEVYDTPLERAAFY